MGLEPTTRRLATSLRGYAPPEVIAETALALALDAPPSHATQQARVYAKQGRTHDAQLMRKLSKVPQGVWISGPAPRKAVARVMKQAGGKVPVLVAYDLPCRHGLPAEQWWPQYALGLARRSQALD